MIEMDLLLKGGLFCLGDGEHSKIGVQIARYVGIIAKTHRRTAKYPRTHSKINR